MGPYHPLHNLVCQCLENIPEKRPSATEIINSLLKFTKKIKGKLSRNATGEKVGAMSNIQYDHKLFAGERIEKSLIAERQRSPRHEVLDPVVIVLENTNASDSKTGNNSAGKKAEDDSTKNKKTLVLLSNLRISSLKISVIDFTYRSADPGGSGWL